MGRRRALCNLASQLSEGTFPREFLRRSADHEAATPVAVLADRLQHAARTVHVLVGPAVQSHGKCLAAEQMQPLQQGQKYKPAQPQHDQGPVSVTLPSISRRSALLHVNGLPVQLSAIRLAHSSAGSDTRPQPGPRRSPQDSRPFRRSDPHVHRPPSGLSGPVRHSSNDGSSDLDWHSTRQEPAGSPDRHLYDSAAAWGLGPSPGQPESGQDNQRGSQQNRVQRSNLGRAGPQSMQGNGSEARTPPPGYQRSSSPNQRSDWWQPPPPQQARSSPGASPLPSCLLFLHFS